MRNRHIVVLAACLGSVLALCATCLAGGGTAKAPSAPQGAMVVESAEVTATVEAVDPTTRVVTLKMKDGRTEKVKCGPDVVNFDQIKVGDKVKAKYVESIAVSIAKGAQPGAGAASTVMLAPKGAKPGGVEVNTITATAKVDSVHTTRKTVTLDMPDGTKKTLKIGPNGPDLKNLKKGDDVTVTYTEAFGIKVQKP